MAETKDTEKRQKWYGKVKRREEGHMLKRTCDAPIRGKISQKSGGNTRVVEI